MNSVHTYDRASLNRSEAGPGALMRSVETLLQWRDRARSRRMLGTLDDHMLRDIGLNRAAAATESDKPFWRP